MPKHDYDVVTVGGGLGGAALAKTLAEAGRRVLVIERELEFRDRIRGEWMAPWGVAELRKLGIHDLLLKTCAHEQPYFHAIPFPTRDLRTTTPHQLPALTFYHPVMQQVVLDAASQAGAEVWRGASARLVTPGHPPSINVEINGEVRELHAHFIVCADGKGSMARVWGGFAAQRGRPGLLGAGVLLEQMQVADDTSVLATSFELRQVAILFPQGGRRARAYFNYPPGNGTRIQGQADAERFIDGCICAGMPAEYYVGVRAVAPLASFDMTEHWLNHPYRGGVALVGDAAGATDPTWGQGLSMTARDVRVLSEKLLQSDDWEAAGQAYAREHEGYFKAAITMEDWQFELFFGQGHEADARRARALPLIAQEPDRISDHLFTGPDVPCDEVVRRRFFGEV
jgi:2-polyprenyl-6-methoxyphenol hydroxylase-like FAD-dependent oxidoreductase